MEDDGTLSFFTSNHPRHDSLWIFRGSSFKFVCIACLIETLEDKDVLAIRKKKSLTEILLLLSRDNTLVEVLSRNARISTHLCAILVNLLETANEAIGHMSVEGIVQLALKLQSNALVREILDNLEGKILSLNNLRKAYPYIVLFGKLLDAIPLLAEEIIERKDKLWKYCISGLTFPEENVKVALIYLVLSVFKSKKAKGKITVEIKGEIFKRSCENLIDGKNKDIRLNSLALLQCFTCPEDIKMVQLLAEDKESKDRQTILASALKKTILSTEQGLQIGGIQCTTKFISLDSETRVFSGALLRCGLAEFLFEALETNNDIVLASLFCCLTELCKSHEFFNGSYSIYGIDSVVSGIVKAFNLQNPETIQQGLHVLSTIISKQMKEVPLLSNGTIFDRCLKVAEEGLKAMEYKVLQEAIHLVASLLRVDQLPSSYDVTRMLNPLNGVVAVLKRFTSKTVESFSGMQSGTAQELLSALLAVINQAINFTNDYTNKSPSLEEVLLRGHLPSNNSATKDDPVQTLKKFLVKAIDETCIVAVMINYEAISDASVFEILFKILNSQLESTNEKSVAFAKKLASASFIRISMEVSDRFCKGGSNKPLMKEMQKFQRSLFSCLNDGYKENEKMLEMFELAAVPSSPDEFITLLSQSCLDPISLHISDNTLFKIQCFCIELLYLSYMYKDFITTDQVLLGGIHQFICLNRNLGVLPVLSLKHLLFLYADITMKYKRLSPNERPSGLIESQRILEETLLKLQLEEFRAVSSQEASFVLWVFQSDPLSKAFGKSLIEVLLSNDEEDCLLLRWSFLKGNDAAVKDLLSLILQYDTSTVSKIVHVIEKILDTSPENQRGKTGTTAQIIAEELHKLFLKNQENPLPDHVLTAMLKILLSLQMYMGEEVDMKLFHLVVDVLIKATGKSSQITIAAVNYLNVALWSNMQSARPRVAAVVLSNKDFMTWLQKVMAAMQSLDHGTENSSAINVFAVGIFLMANLVYCQSKLGISGTYSVALEKEGLIELLNDHHNCLLQLASLVFWKTILESTSKTFVIFNKEEPDADGGSNCSTEIDCKVILIYLQNAMMHENNMIRNSSIRCLKAFLSCSQRRAYCSLNPWNKMILESLLFSSMQSKLDSSLLQFCEIMMNAEYFRNMEEILASANEVILRQILNVPVHLDENGQLPATAKHCINFLRELMSFNFQLLQRFVTDELIAWIKRLQENAKQERKIKILGFTKDEQIVLPKEIVKDHAEMDARVLAEVVWKLETSHTETTML